MSEKLERKARRKAICAIHQPLYKMEGLEQHGRTQGGSISQTFYAENTEKSYGISEVLSNMNDRPKRCFSTSSSSEHKTRLTCPKGLLITTEAPKSGEVYRHRSNTDVVLTDKTRIATFHHSDLDKSKVEILLEQSENDRKKLLKENGRLQEELDNRNKVIDHLIDYMKSLIPTEESELEGN